MTPSLEAQSAAANGTADTPEVLRELLHPSLPFNVERETRSLDFADRSALRVLGEGWQTRGGIPFWQRESHIWATHLFAELAVTVLAPRDQVLSLDLFPHALDNMPPQEVVVFWEGRRIGALQFAEEDGWRTKTLTCAVPASCQKKGANEIRIMSRYAVARADVEGAGDGREAAVALRGLSLRDAGANEAVPEPLCEIRDGRLVQNAYARARLPIILPDAVPLSIEVEIEGVARLSLCWDAPYANETVKIFEAGSATPQSLQLDLTPWRGRLVELVFESASTNADDTVTWRSPRLVGTAAAPLVGAAGTAANRGPDLRSASRLLSEGSNAPPLPALKGKNVVLVILDALRADALGCYGSPRGTSPFIDALAQQGILFERAYSADTATYTSTTTLLTSLHGFQHRVLYYTDKLAYEDALLQVWLNRHGVRTACVSQNPFLSPENIIGKHFASFQGVFGLPQHSPKGCAEVTQAALMAAEDAGENPFFLYTHYLPPHAPYTMAGEYQERFSYDPVKDIEPHPGWIRGAQEQRNLLDSHGAEQLRARYDENVRRADECVRQLVTGLRELGYGKETVLIVTADHGEEFAEHGWVGHAGRPYDTQCHIPLIVTTLAEGGLGQGRRVDRLVGTVDVAPTICGLLEVDVLPNAMGSDLLAGSPADRPLVFSRGMAQYAVEAFVFERYKLLLDTAGTYERLFDLSRDPGETQDLSATLPVLASYLRARAERWKADLTERYVLPESAPPADVSTREEEQEEVGPAHEESLRALGYL
ncbi:MAG: sulfatase-like hydrolase/transferase [Nitrospiraceae bacterium]|nr:sulfatase-like hydrolase/transferase [Nitrospiraceae bacterium]